jgi:hypothetical protein
MQSGGLKEIMKSVQTPTAAYFNAVSYATHPQIRQAWQVNHAFQQVLDLAADCPETVYGMAGIRLGSLPPIPRTRVECWVVPNEGMLTDV